MTRETSIEAYMKIKESGLLSERRWEVYNVVYNNGPLTSAEAFRILNAGRPIKNITQSRARFTELRDMGVFKEVGEKFCSITGHKVILWDVTSKLPIEISKPLPAKTRVIEMLLKLQEEVECFPMIQTPYLINRLTEIMNAIKKI
jgi:hypothetical protein